MPETCKTYLDCESGVCELIDVPHWPKPEYQNDWETNMVRDLKQDGITLRRGASFGICPLDLEDCFFD